MQIQEIVNILDASIVTNFQYNNLSIKYGYGCDLMSDVLAFVKHNVLLLTGLVHPQVIRTAEMLDLKAIVFVRDKKPTEQIIKMANERKIVLIVTNYSLYTSCGLLYSNGLLGEEIGHETKI